MIRFFGGRAGKKKGFITNVVLLNNIVEIQAEQISLLEDELAWYRHLLYATKDYAFRRDN